MKGDEKFLETYNKLNDAQKEAVDSIDGPVVVVAGPGTGKTQILTLRIANILRQTDTRPEQILALTFTEAGASAMRSRLASIIGVTAYRVPIFTFHGFCNEVINRFPEFFPDILGSRPAGEVDRITIMQKVFDESHFEYLASFRSPYHYVKPSLRTISLLKREAIDQDELRARLDREEKEIANALDYRHEKGAHKGKVKGMYLERELSIAKNRELATLYDGYEVGLAKNKLFDFDDMITALVRGLEKNEELRLILQEEYQYLLADEHQDANGAQNKVLELLSSFHESPNLFIVGDDKQAIYRFQGASLENFLYFHNRFPEAKLINLTQNYRSTQTVLDTAHQLIPTKDFKLSACPPAGEVGVGHAESKIFVREFLGADDEATAIAREVASKIKSGVRPIEIAIFTRTNRELGVYSSALVRADVPVSIETKEDVLEDTEIEKILLLINTAVNIGDDGPLVKVLHLDCFVISELDIYLLARAASRSRKSIWQICQSTEELNQIGLQNVSEILRVVKLISAWSKEGYNISPARLVSNIANNSGVTAQMLNSPNAETKLAKLAMLLSYLESFTRSRRGARINDLAELLQLVDDYNVLEVDSKGVVNDKVKLCTAHRSKGLEFDHVYIVGAVEGNWSGGRSHSDFKIPGIMATSKKDEEADDKRLFYVAITRARQDLAISYSIVREDGKAQLPSRFLGELPGNCIIKESYLEKPGAADILNRLSPADLPRKNEREIKSLVTEVLLDRGLAVTGLNNYLKCPWQYFYRTLLRVPEPQTVPLMFGNAVHRAMKIFFDAWAERKDLTKETFVARLELELERESFNDKELANAKKEGAAALLGYYDHWYPNWNREIKNEFPVDVTISISDLNIRLTGKLDKIEFGAAGQVGVVDYKTGKPKSRNFIEGKTEEDGSGDYKRQLVYYKLLLDLFDGGKYCMDGGIIDFIMSGENGKPRREEFVITKEEVAALRADVERVLDEILSLSFWNKRCDDKTCEYCKLREMIS
ncbi:MAG: ATP-dependent helicase [Candidatus Vogelbacteria bacterium]|nr:ATP-dependent helicase [Candidatus Vogelbacteria bacterium]